MASNFFEQQDAARKKTGYLVGLFALGVLGITLLIYGVMLVVIIGGQDSNAHASSGPDAAVYLGTFVVTFVGVLVVVGGCSLFKIVSLRSGGGESVAQMMGGTLLHPQTRDMDERKIMNVVEEMALASGTPVPPVYLMENESSINAFAAGYSPDNAVIGITRGAIEKLSRDELQGVVAHEFSHILNGDMRLNIRLMGVIFGIIAIAVIGRVLLRVGFYSSGGRKKDAKAAIAMALIGLALLIIGGVGVLMGRLIQAAVSRQREYLADASAVQFTRNPDTIGGALKRIGGVGSSLKDGHADEVGHMCIANAMSSWGFGPFATHPPLEERIKRIDPSWNGEFSDPNERIQRQQAQAKHRQPEKLDPIPLAGDAAALPGMPGGLPGAVIGGAIIADAAGGAAPSKESAVDQIGQVSPTHVSYMHELLDRIPQTMKDAAHDPESARAVIYTVLLDKDAQVRAKQIEFIAKHADPAVTALTRELAEQAGDLPKEARLPLIDMAVPALREMSGEVYERFKKKVDALIKADGRVDLFEWVLQRLLIRHLDLHFVHQPEPKVRYFNLRGLTSPCGTVLSALAHIGQREADDAKGAFDAGAGELGVGSINLQDRKSVKLKEVGKALDELMLASPREKQKLIRACAKTIAADGEVTRGEGELMRAVADSLAVPMPPLLPGQKLV
ncbi:MAG: M48 family metallopeptidase [Phycisphaeraceae bacterium]|nr:M48 family metallopeptidase [Phycisphaeraceae bacterium]